MMPIFVPDPDEDNRILGFVGIVWSTALFLILLVTQHDRWLENGKEEAPQTFQIAESPPVLDVVRVKELLAQFEAHRENIRILIAAQIPLVEDEQQRALLLSYLAAVSDDDNRVLITYLQQQVEPGALAIPPIWLDEHVTKEKEFD